MLEITLIGKTKVQQDATRLVTLIPFLPKIILSRQQTFFTCIIKTSDFNLKQHCLYQSKYCHLSQFKNQVIQQLQEMISLQRNEEELLSSPIKNQLWVRCRRKRSKPSNISCLDGKKNQHRRNKEGNNWLSTSDKRFAKEHEHYTSYKDRPITCMHLLNLDSYFSKLIKQFTIRFYKLCFHTNKR